MKKISCLLLEDEPLAAELLQDYIRQVPFLDLRASCADALQALAVLQQERIDLLFLDMHLPRIKGLDFLRSLAQPPRVIVVSAYPDYALPSFELSVVDYLLKPVEWPRFLMAVNKLQPAALPAVAEGTPRPHLYFNVAKRRVRVFVDEILYVESLKEYIRICTAGKTILTRYPLSALEEVLAPGRFLRIHRSFLVAKDRIDTFSANDVEVGGKQLPIGRNYKDAVLAALGGTEL